VYIFESTLKIKFENFHFDKYQQDINIEIDVYVMFKIKYGLNKIHPILFSHQVGWFDGRGVDIHVCGLRIKLHK